MILKCVRCGSTMADEGIDYMHPIDPKGTKDRRWVCNKCERPEEYNAVHADVKHIENIILEDNKRRTNNAKDT